MAKIIVQVEVDTDEKTMDVSINGEKINNVSYVSCSRHFDRYDQVNRVDVSVSSSETNKETGVSKQTNYYAYGSKEAREIGKSEAINTIAGLVGVEIKDHTNALAEYLSVKLSR